MPEITKRRLEILLEKLRDGLSICDQGRNKDHCVKCPIKDAMIEAEAITEVMLIKRNENTGIAAGLKNVNRSNGFKNHGPPKRWLEST